MPTIVPHAANVSGLQVKTFQRLTRCPTCQTQFTVPGKKELEKLRRREEQELARRKAEADEKAKLQAAAKAEKQARAEAERLSREEEHRRGQELNKQTTIAPSLPNQNHLKTCSGVTTVREQQRRCPFCSEHILATALKCKHCGEFMDGRGTGTGQQKGSGGCGQVMIIAFGIVVGFILLMFL